MQFGADGFDGGVGQADDHGTQGRVQFHLKGDDHHHVAGRHDGRELRVDFAAHQFQLDVVHGSPGFFHIVQGDLDDLVHHGLLDAREFAAFNLGLGARAAEDVFHQGEDQARVHHHDGVAAQGIHLEDVDGGGHGQGAHELPELGHVDGNGVQLHTLAHGVGQGVGAEPRETVIDDFQHRHAAADDAVLIGEVKGHDAGIVFQHLGFAFDLAAGKPAQQGIHFVLCQNFVHTASKLLLMCLFGNQNAKKRPD